MNDLNPAARPEPGTAYATGRTRLPVAIAFSHLPHFERAAPDGSPATMKFRRPDDLLAGDVIEGLRDPWAVVAHVTRSGPDVTVRVQEAGGSRTMALGARKLNFSVRSDLRVDPSTIPDIPDGFPPRWGVWRNEPLLSGTLAWHPEPGEAAEHARQASRDGREYVVELEARRHLDPGRRLPAGQEKRLGNPAGSRTGKNSGAAMGHPGQGRDGGPGHWASHPSGRQGRGRAGQRARRPHVRPRASRQQLPRPRANRAVRRTAQPCRPPGTAKPSGPGPGAEAMTLTPPQGREPRELPAGGQAIRADGTVPARYGAGRTP